MTFFKEGNNPMMGTPAADVQAYTFGYRLANGKVTPCTAQGQRAEFVFNDTVEAVENGFGVGLMSLTHSGGTGVPVLAGGVIPAGDELIVDMVNFTIDGATVSLPVAKSVSDAAEGDWIVGFATMGSSATEADTDANAPSIAIEFYSQPKTNSGGLFSYQVFTFPVSLADIAADTLIEWTPGFAGELISDAFIVTDPATTAAKAATLNIEINTTNVTGGVLALTSANMTPEGNVVAGTAITANNTFDANDKISIEATAITAFVEGAGIIQITVRVPVGTA